MKYESSFKSEADGLEISVMALIPDKKPYRAVVQLVHGMSEHKERYIPFMQYLAKLGYVVVIHDHRGHGKSVKHQDDLGFTYGGGAQAMLQDIRTVNRKIHAYYPELPLILMGHSMGSLAVRAFVAEQLCRYADRVWFAKLQYCHASGSCHCKDRESSLWTETQK